jgi:hypothetical protein
MDKSDGDEKNTWLLSVLSCAAEMRWKEEKCRMRRLDRLDVQATCMRLACSATFYMVSLLMMSYSQSMFGQRADMNSVQRFDLDEWEMMSFTRRSALAAASCALQVQSVDIY